MVQQKAQLVEGSELRRIPKVGRCDLVLMRWIECQHKDTSSTTSTLPSKIDSQSYASRWSPDFFVVAEAPFTKANPLSSYRIRDTHRRKYPRDEYVKPKPFLSPKACIPSSTDNISHISPVSCITKNHQVTCVPSVW
jgi:hypothetical protein